MAPYHFAVEVEDWDGFLAHLDELGIRHTRVITRPENNSQFCYIHDPDHTMIELVFHARRPYPPVPKKDAAPAARPRTRGSPRRRRVRRRGARRAGRGRGAVAPAWPYAPSGDAKIYYEVHGAGPGRAVRARVRRAPRRLVAAGRRAAPDRTRSSRSTCAASATPGGSPTTTRGTSPATSSPCSTRSPPTAGRRARCSSASPSARRPRCGPRSTGRTAPPGSILGALARRAAARRADRAGQGRPGAWPSSCRCSTGC